MQKIDIVYLWCDGSDKRFVADKKKYLAEETAEMDVEATGALRFYDNEELKYSLRSLEKYASWINHVFIVTDRQCPKWLNREYSKVTIVDHSEILPPEDIPTFESLAIEYRLYKIPGLAEKFLYANDDMFFGSKVSPEFFFLDNKPIVRVSSYPKIKKILSAKEFNTVFANSSLWLRTNLHTWKILQESYGQNKLYLLHHNIDAYIKSEFKSIVETYAKQLASTLHGRFRKENNISRMLLGLDCAYRGSGILKVVKKMNFRQKHLWWSAQDCCESYTGSENSKTIKQIKRFKPNLFCINADKNNRLEDKLKIKEFMQEILPRPSKFEKNQ